MFLFSTIKVVGNARMDDLVADLEVVLVRRAIGRHRSIPSRLKLSGQNNAQLDELHA